MDVDTTTIIHDKRTLLSSSDISQYLDNIINDDNSKKIILYNNDNDIITSFAAPYKNNYRACFDIKLMHLYYNEATQINEGYDTNVIKFCLEAADNIIPSTNTQLYPSIFSIKNKIDSNLISFYNNNSHTYINIGSHNNVIYTDQQTNNISLHIQDYSKYLLQLTNDNETDIARFSLHNKISDTLNSFWIFEGPDKINNNLNIQYGYNNNNNNYPEYINNILTLTKNNNIGINDTDPNYPLQIKSTDNTSLKLINLYTDSDNTFNNNNDFSLINVYNSNLYIDINIDKDPSLSNINFNYSIDILSSNIPDYTLNSKYIYEGFKNSTNYIKTNNYYKENDLIMDILLPKSIIDYNLKFDNLNSNHFAFVNNFKNNKTDPNIIDIDNYITLPSFSFSNYYLNNNSNYNFNINNSNITTNNLTSNILIQFNGETNPRQFNINNTYDFINGLTFTCNLTNVLYDYDNIDNIHNIHTSFSNLLVENIYTNLNHLIYTNSNFISNSNLNIFTSNVLSYDPNLTCNINIDLSYKLFSKYNVNINTPTTILKNNDIQTKLISKDYNYDNSCNIYNIVTSNYLKKDILGISDNDISISNSSNIIDIKYNIDNLDFVFDNNNCNISNKDIDIKIVNYYEKYNINNYKHYLITNVIDDVPHIILDNLLTNNNCNIGGTNKIYSTSDGDFKINYDDITNKNLITLNKNGNVFINDGSLFVKNIYVDNILNIQTSNNIITDNSNHLNSLGYIHATDNFNLMTSNTNFISSNINFDITGNNNNSINIKKTGIYLINNPDNILNNIIDISANNDIDIIYKNAFSLSLLNTTIYGNFGSDNNAKIGIGKNLNDTEYNLDINGQIRTSANKLYNIEEPHLILDTKDKSIIYGLKKYDNNYIYSSDGDFRITAYNSITDYQKDLIKLTDGKLESDSIVTNTIQASQIYDLYGNSLIPDFTNMNDNEFLYNISNLHIISSNVQFTTSNLNIAIEKNKENYFSINKIRNKDVDNILIENIINGNQIYSDIQFNQSLDYLYSSFIQINQNTFLSSSITHNTINKHKTDNSSIITVSSTVYQEISDIYYDFTNYLLYIADSSLNKIFVILYNNSTYDDSSDLTPNELSFDFGSNSFNFNTPYSLYLDQDILYVSSISNIYEINVSTVKNGIYNNLPINIFTGDPTLTGYIDNTINAKFNNITSIISFNNIIYLADMNNYSIRKITKDTKFVTTIAGSQTTPPRDGSAIGDGIDSRFNNIQKILITNDNEFLIILDKNIEQRILILELNTNYVSTIFNTTNLDITTITLYNNIIYLIAKSNIYKLDIIDFNVYKKINILELIEDNNILSITSIPHDSILHPYYTMENDYVNRITGEKGYVNSMSIKTNKKSTFIQFGSSNQYEKAYIGIATEPVFNTELTVNGSINTENIDVNNTLRSLNNYSSNLYNNNLYSINNNNNIIFNANFLPGNTYDSANNNYGIGSIDKKLGDIFIGDNNNLYIGDLSMKKSGPKVKFISDSIGSGIELSEILLKNNDNNDKAYIKFENSKITYDLKDASDNIITRSEDFSGTITSQDIIVSNNLTVSNNIGIRNSSPNFPLEVDGSGPSENHYIKYFNSTTGLTDNTISISNTVAKFNGSILSSSWIGSASSILIKKDIENLDDNECLNKCLQLKPKKYRYIDETNNFDETKKIYGFIAEDIVNILPEMIDDKHSHLIPNIYKKGNIINNILYIDSELINGSEYISYYKISNTDAEEIKFIVLDKINNNEYRININLNCEIFVYGIMQNNFKSIKKEYLHAISISSIQELNRKINNQQILIDTLIERITLLENK